MAKSSKANELIILGMKIYQTNDICWMNYQITRENKLTFHHIKPVRKSSEDETIFENMALLSAEGYHQFNYIERKNYIIAKQLNRLFKKLNDSMSPPTEEYYDELDYYLRKFEQRTKKVYFR